MHARRLVERGEATREELDAIEASQRERVEASIERARSLAAPEPEEAFAHVRRLTPRRPQRATSTPS